MIKASKYVDEKTNAMFLLKQRSREELAKYPLRHSVEQVLDDPRSSKAAGTVFLVLTTNLFVSVFVWYLDTTVLIRTNEDAWQVTYRIELICTLIFLVEAATRMYAYSTNPWKHLRDPFIWMDIVAVAPDVIEFVWAIAVNDNPLYALRHRTQPPSDPLALSAHH